MQNHYRHTKDVLKHSAVYKKRKKVRKIKMALFGLLFVVVFVALIFAVRMSIFTISEIQVKGLQSASTQSVIDEINSEINGNYALVLPKKNILFYPKSTIKENLLNKFGTFADVEINTIDTNKLEISITEKNAAAIGCQSEQSILDNTYANCFFVDSNYKGFQPVVGEPDKSLVRFVYQNASVGQSSSGGASTSSVPSTSSVAPASPTLSSDVIIEVQKLKTDLEKRNLIIHYIKIVDAKNFEFQIIGNGKIFVSLPFDDNLLSILNTALSTKQLSGGVIFEYIDVRFGNKVFYKLGNGTGSVEASRLEASSMMGTSSVMGTSTETKSTAQTASSSLILRSGTKNTASTTAKIGTSTALKLKSVSSVNKSTSTSSSIIKKKKTKSRTSTIPSSGTSATSTKVKR